MHEIALDNIWMHMDARNLRPTGSMRIITSVSHIGDNMIEK